MDAERLEIARRFVACPGWVWLPGMVACRMDGDVCVNDARIDAMGEAIGHPGMALNGTETECAARFHLHGRIPDLDDPLTRLGCLSVVRMARNEPNGSLMPVIMQNGSVESWAYYPMTEGRRPFYAASELLSLLAALEAAPK